ncbi:porin [Paludibacterium yongneupense]|uniref:porin n=1 Tax=Paludibacterium yongneupense TaxID=400061 RepID=UPI0004228A92|nr:porin [Paludibacterium yongneupense]
MKKRMIAAAITAIGLSPLAQADVTLYGFMSASVESVKATGNGSASNEMGARLRVEDQNSRIGIKGNEDLGNGTRAIWQVESALRNFEQGGTTDTGTSAVFATRNTFVGLDNSRYGTIQLGNHDSSYRRLTTIAIGQNVMADTTADISANNNSTIGNRGDTRLANSVHYTTPVVGGLQVGLSWGADETRASDTNQAQTNRARYTAAALYTHGGLKVAAGFDRTNDTAAKLGTGSFNTAYAGKNRSFYKVAAAYRFVTNTALIGDYEYGSYGSATGSSDMKQSDWTIALTQDFGAATLKAAYHKLGKLSNATTGTPEQWAAKQWILGGTYNLSKQTQLLAYYTRLQNNTLQNANFGVDGLYSSGNGTTSAALAAGNTLTAIGAGIKVCF